MHSNRPVRILHNSHYTVGWLCIAVTGMLPHILNRSQHTADWLRIVDLDRLVRNQHN